MVFIKSQQTSQIPQISQVAQLYKLPSNQTLRNCQQLSAVIGTKKSKLQHNDLLHLLTDGI